MTKTQAAIFFFAVVTIILGIAVLIPRIGDHRGSRRSTSRQKIPPHFKTGVSDAEATRMWQATLEWRAANGIDEILKTAPPHYDIITRHFPSFMHLTDRHKNLVVIDKWKDVDIPGLSTHGIGHDELIRHYMFQLEWLWSVALPNEDDMVTMIYDIDGVRYDQITSAVFNLVKDRVLIGCENYPNRASLILAVNVPPFMVNFYNLISTILRQETKSKVRILSKADLQAGALTEIIPPAHLIPEYGGTCRVPLGKSPMDLKQKRHVQRLQKRESQHKRRNPRESITMEKVGQRMEMMENKEQPPHRPAPLFHRIDDSGSRGEEEKDWRDLSEWLFSFLKSRKGKTVVQNEEGGGYSTTKNSKSSEESESAAISYCMSPLHCKM